MSLFSHVLCNYLINLIKSEECPKVHFPSFLETKISVSEIPFQRVLMFFMEIWRECCPIISQKNCEGNFYFWLISKVMTILVKRTHVLSKLKVCQKQTRLVIKIP